MDNELSGFQVGERVWVCDWGTIRANKPAHTGPVPGTIDAFGEDMDDAYCDMTLEDGRKFQTTTVYKTEAEANEALLRGSLYSLVGRLDRLMSDVRYMWEVHAANGRTPPPELADLLFVYGLVQEMDRIRVMFGTDDHSDLCPVLTNRQGGASPARFAEDLEIPTAARAQFLNRAAKIGGRSNWGAILSEEHSEAVEAAALNDAHKLKVELFQVAAVAAAWYGALLRRESRDESKAPQG